MEPTLHHIERTTSTQLEARRLVAGGIAKTGDIVLANEQTDGTGRFGNSWISPRGGLYVTFILVPDPLVSLKAGLAVVRVLHSAGIEAGLKWPNDVLVERRKIAGILIETEDNHSLVGIGLNLTSAPLETSTCVSQHAVVSDCDEWVLAISRELIKMSSGNFDLDEYRTACVTLGQAIRIEGIADRPRVEGMAVDVDADGRLVVQTEEGQRTISSGECSHLRALHPDG